MVWEFSCIVIWLLLAGLSFRHIAPGTDRKAVGVVLVACLVLAPFTAGVSLYEAVARKPSKKDASK